MTMICVLALECRMISVIVGVVEPVDAKWSVSYLFVDPGSTQGSTKGSNEPGFIIMNTASGRWADNSV